MSEKKEQPKAKPTQDKTKPTPNKPKAEIKKNEALSLWEKALEQIAGNNKLLASVLKIALGPIGLFAMICGLGYLLWKNKTHKDKISALEKELLEIKFEKKDLEKAIAGFRKNRKHHEINDEEEQALIDEEKEMRGTLYIPTRLSQNHQHTNRNKNIHLD